MSNLIPISLSPNAELDDVLLALRTLLMPWRWKHGTSQTHVASWFQKQYPKTTVFLYNSGRSALYELLKAFGIQAGDEVLVPSFTCVAVPNCVLWLGARPVYVDIDHTGNIDPAQVKQKITKRTKAIIVQHTFGIPVNMELFKELSERHKVVLIEDCAHALGISYNGKLLGSFGDGAIFSFGRDKILSSVFGGVGIISQRHPDVIRSLSADYQRLRMPRMGWILQQLLHPVAFAIILPLYRGGIGKALLVLLQKLQLLSFPVYPEEKQGRQPADFPALYPNALTNLAFHQLRKLDAYQQQRSLIVALYQKKLQGINGITILPVPDGVPLLRFPILVHSPEHVLQQAKRQGILLGHWYQNLIDPKGVNEQALQFTASNYPRATEIAAHIVNLPTRITLVEANRIIDLLKQLYEGTV